MVVVAPVVARVSRAAGRPQERRARPVVGVVAPHAERARRETPGHSRDRVHDPGRPGERDRAHEGGLERGVPHRRSREDERVGAELPDALRGERDGPAERVPEHDDLLPTVPRARDHARQVPSNEGVV
ncbi:MAG: hypothetical protein ACK56I_36595, partial [bacterium]